MTSTLSPEMRERLNAFCTDIGRDAPVWERERTYPLDAMREAGKAGLTGMMTPEASGGLGLGHGESCDAAATMAAADFGLAFALKVHASVAASVAASGRSDLVERYLDDLLGARLIGAFLLTEPGAGSDAAAIATSARRDGDEWVIDGEKAWVTNGVAAGLLKVFVQTDASQGWRGIAAFLVEGDADGVERTAPYILLGGHSAGVCGIRFSSVRVDRSAMIHEPGEAFRGAMQGIDAARVGVAAMCCGMIGASLDQALDAVASRNAFGRTVGDFQGIQWMLADAATDFRAAKLLTREAVDLFDRGEDASIACAHAKKFATRVAWKAISDCMQVMGARGFRVDDGHPLARHLACARMAQWLDGATEIQNVVIVRSLMRGRRN